jgi:hypothetical protein
MPTAPNAHFQLPIIQQKNAGTAKDWTLMVNMGVEPTTLALLAPRSNQLS